MPDADLLNAFTTTTAETTAPPIKDVGVPALTEDPASSETDPREPEAIAAPLATDQSDTLGETDRHADGTFKAKTKKPRDDAHARIAQLTAKLHAAERERDAARVPPPVAVLASTTPPAKPTEDQVGTTYATYADFVDALSDWKADQREGKLRDELTQEFAAADTRRRAETVYAGHLARVETFRQTHPDFDDIIASVSVSEAMGRAIIESDRGPELAYYLGQHPEVSTQLVEKTKTLSADAAPLVLDLLLSRLGAAPAGSAPVVLLRKLPSPPIKPVGASPSVPDADDISPDLPTDQYFDRRMAQDARARRHA